MKKYRIVLVVLALAVSMAACGGGNGNNDESGFITEPDSAIPDTQDDDAETGSENEQPPATIDMELEIEGMKEIRTGTLAKSDNGYYFYTVPPFVFTAEEPGIDQVFMESYPDYFMRIQPLGESVDLDVIRENADEEMKLVGGEVTELKGDQIGDSFIRNAEFFLHSTSKEFTKQIIVIEINEQWFKFTMHMPSGEASEGAEPGFRAMIKTVRPE